MGRVLARVCVGLGSVLAALVVGCGGTSEPRWKEVTGELGLPPTPPVVPASESFQLWEIMGPGVGLLDHDQDGDLDIVVAAAPPPDELSSAAPNQLWRQAEDGSLEEVARELGLADPGIGQGVTIGDVDSDGDEDVYFGNFGPDRFYRNDGGRFLEATAAAGLGAEQWTCSATFLDADNDGDLDLFVTHYVQFRPDEVCHSQDTRREFCAPMSFEPELDTFYVNTGDGRFVDRTEAAGIQLAGYGLGAISWDVNRDGHQDIYVANDNQPNHLWINQGDVTFMDEAFLRGVALNRDGQQEASMGLAVGDVDRDQDLDLFLTHLEQQTNTLYVAEEQGLFRDLSIAAGMVRVDRPYTGFGCALVDFDLDGWLDVGVANGRIRRRVDDGDQEFWSRYGEPNLFFLGGPEGFAVRREAFGPTAEMSRGLAVGDLDRDGAPDWVVADRSGHLRVFRNQWGGDRHWLVVRPLIGVRAALGAEVRVETDQGPQVGLCLANGSYASSVEPVVHFGLAEASRVDSIQVRWPDGREERFAGVAADQEVTVVRGTGETP